MKTIPKKILDYYISREIEQKKQKPIVMSVEHPSWLSLRRIFSRNNPDQLLDFQAYKKIGDEIIKYLKAQIKFLTHAQKKGLSSLGDSEKKLERLLSIVESDSTKLNSFREALKSILDPFRLEIKDLFDYENLLFPANEYGFNNSNRAILRRILDKCDGGNIFAAAKAKVEAKSQHLDTYIQESINQNDILDIPHPEEEDILKISIDFIENPSNFVSNFSTKKILFKLVADLQSDYGFKPSDIASNIDLIFPSKSRKVKDLWVRLLGKIKDPDDLTIKTSNFSAIPSLDTKLKNLTKEKKPILLSLLWLLSTRVTTDSLDPQIQSKIDNLSSANIALDSSNPQSRNDIYRTLKFFSENPLINQTTLGKVETSNLPDGIKKLFRKPFLNDNQKLEILQTLSSLLIDEKFIKSRTDNLLSRQSQILRKLGLHLQNGVFFDRLRRFFIANPDFITHSYPVPKKVTNSRGEEVEITKTQFRKFEESTMFKLRQFDSCFAGFEEDEIKLVYSELKEIINDSVIDYNKYLNSDSLTEDKKPKQPTLDPKLIQFVLENHRETMQLRQIYKLGLPEITKSFQDLDINYLKIKRSGLPQAFQDIFQGLTQSEIFQKWIEYASYAIDLDFLKEKFNALPDSMAKSKLTELNILDKPREYFWKLKQEFDKKSDSLDSQTLELDFDLNFNGLSGKDIQDVISSLKTLVNESSVNYSSQTDLANKPKFRLQGFEDYGQAILDFFQNNPRPSFQSSKEQEELWSHYCSLLIDSDVLKTYYQELDPDTRGVFDKYSLNNQSQIDYYKLKMFFDENKFFVESSPELLINDHDTSLYKLKNLLPNIFNNLTLDDARTIYEPLKNIINFSFYGSSTRSNSPASFSLNEKHKSLLQPFNLLLQQEDYRFELFKFFRDNPYFNSRVIDQIDSNRLPELRELFGSTRDDSLKVEIFQQLKKISDNCRFLYMLSPAERSLIKPFEADLENYDFCRQLENQLRSSRNSRFQNSGSDISIDSALSEQSKKYALERDKLQKELFKHIQEMQFDPNGVRFREVLQNPQEVFRHFWQIGNLKPTVAQVVDFIRKSQDPRFTRRQLLQRGFVALISAGIAGTAVYGVNELNELNREVAEARYQAARFKLTDRIFMNSGNQLTHKELFLDNLNTFLNYVLDNPELSKSIKESLFGVGKLDIPEYFDLEPNSVFIAPNAILNWDYSIETKDDKPLRDYPPNAALMKPVLKIKLDEKALTTALKQAGVSDPNQLDPRANKTYLQGAYDFFASSFQDYDSSLKLPPAFYSFIGPDNKLKIIVDPKIANLVYSPVGTFEELNELFDSNQEPENLNPAFARLYLKTYLDERLKRSFNTSTNKILLKYETTLRELLKRFKYNQEDLEFIKEKSALLENFLEEQKDYELSVLQQLLNENDQNDTDPQTTLKRLVRQDIFYTFKSFGNSADLSLAGLLKSLAPEQDDKVSLQRAKVYNPRALREEQLNSIGNRINFRLIDYIINNLKLLNPQNTI